jgi:hypothetical protein
MVKMYEEGIPGARLTAYLIGVGLIALGGKAAAEHFTADPPESACLNPLLHGPYDITVKEGANVRKSPYRVDSAGDNRAGEPLSRQISFSTKGIGTICIANNGQGEWLGFNDDEFSELTGQELDGNKHHWVWVNKDQNIDIEPIG